MLLKTHPRGVVKQSVQTHLVDKQRFWRRSCALPVHAVGGVQPRSTRVADALHSSQHNDFNNSETPSRSATASGTADETVDTHPQQAHRVREMSPEQSSSAAPARSSWSPRGGRIAPGTRTTTLHTDRVQPDRAQQVATSWSFQSQRGTGSNQAARLSRSPGLAPRPAVLQHNASAQRVYSDPLRGEHQEAAAPQRLESAPDSRDPQGLLQLLRKPVPNEVEANGSGMQLSFLGPRMRPPPGFRPIASTSLRHSHGIWLFNCGEDVQRYLYSQPQLLHRKIERIFVSQRHPDNLLGLPGLLCTLSAARAQGHRSADVPLHVYGPQGVAQFLNTMLSLSDTYLLCPVLVHEFVPMSVHPDNREPEKINHRSRLYRVELPPDQLNEDGYYHGFLEPLLQRHTRAGPPRRTKRNARERVDARANLRPIVLPEPGDPSRTDVPLPAMRWTVHAEQHLKVTAFPVKADRPSWGYCVEEADRAGRLNVAACERLEVYGMLRSKLKDGKEVALRDGTIITPDQVVDPDRPGRRVVLMGATAEPGLAAAVCADADAVILEVGSQDSATVGAHCSLHDALQLQSAARVHKLLVSASDAVAVTQLMDQLPRQLPLQAATDHTSPGAALAEQQGSSQLKSLGVDSHTGSPVTERPHDDGHTNQAVASQPHDGVVSHLAGSDAQLSTSAFLPDRTPGSERQAASGAGVALVAPGDLCILELRDLAASAAQPLPM